MLSRLSTYKETRIYHVYYEQSCFVLIVVEGKFGQTSKSLKIL